MEPDIAWSQYPGESAAEPDIAWSWYIREPAVELDIAYGYCTVGWEAAIVEKLVSVY